MGPQSLYQHPRPCVYSEPVVRKTPRRPTLLFYWHSACIWASHLVRLLCHEIFGGMSGYAARRLRRLAREAAANGTDRTDYTRSHTAHSFVPYYAQRISFSIVMNGAKSILKTLAKASRSRLRSAA